MRNHDVIHRQTDRHADRLIAIPHIPAWNEEISSGRRERKDLTVVSDEQRLSMVELAVEDAECSVCWAADNVTFVRLARQTDGRYLTVVLHFSQHRRKRRPRLSLLLCFSTDRLQMHLSLILVGCVAQWLEHWSLTGEISLSHARPAADGWPLMWVSRPL